MDVWWGFSADDFAETAGAMVLRAQGLSVYQVGERRFKALFGVDTETCAVLWDELLSTMPDDSRPIHLLWCLLFIKVYGTEDVKSVITGAHPKTFRKWVWSFFDAISKLKTVSSFAA